MSSRLLAVSSFARSLSAVRATATATATATAGIFQPQTLSRSVTPEKTAESPYSLTFLRPLRSSSSTSSSTVSSQPQLHATKTRNRRSAPAKLKPPPPPVDMIKKTMMKQQQQWRKVIEQIRESAEEENQKAAKKMKMAMKMHQAMRYRRHLEDPPQFDSGETDSSDSSETAEELIEKLQAELYEPPPPPDPNTVVLRDFPFDDKDLESSDAIWDLYQRWIQFHNLDRPTSEQFRRYSLFKERVKDIRRARKFGLPPPPFGLNQFVDSPNVPIREDQVRNHGPCLKCVVDNLLPTDGRVECLSYITDPSSGKRLVEIVVSHPFLEGREEVDGCHSSKECLS